jgi:hypothetical protein
MVTPPSKIVYEAQHGYACTSSGVCSRSMSDFETIYPGGRKERHIWRHEESVSSDSVDSSVPRVRGTSDNVEELDFRRSGRAPARYEQLLSLVQEL